ncbi:MAG: TMEM165/GDT1 family protein [Alphaproteobacteria bacterium]|nr:TMEM165/GDT1 family protein [Alphaproteobacteria bacterium]
MQAFIASFLFVVLAEMGDKTQLLAMAFAARYKASKVLLAVFLATILNHGLAVATGHYLSTVIPMETVSLVAALSFIGFGLWTVRGDTLDGEDKKTSRFGPVATVAIAFFLAEMGDKTQLATVSLAADYRDAFNVLMGTTTGMVVADAIGIVFGIVMKKHIPEKTVKWVSAAVFVLFGLVGTHRALSGMIQPSSVWLVTILLLVGTLWAGRKLSKTAEK